jgi:hypothetical protein
MCPHLLFYLISIISIVLVSCTLTNPKAFKNRFQAVTAVAAVVPAVTTAAAATAAAAVT